MESHDGVRSKVVLASHKEESLEDLQEPDVTIKVTVTHVGLDKILKLVNQQTLKGYSAGYEDGYSDGFKMSNILSFTYGFSTGLCAAALYLYINHKK